MAYDVLTSWFISSFRQPILISVCDSPPCKCQLIFLILTTVIIHHSFILSLLAENVLFLCNHGLLLLSGLLSQINGLFMIFFSNSSVFFYSSFLLLSCLVPWTRRLTWLPISLWVQVKFFLSHILFTVWYFDAHYLCKDFSNTNTRMLLTILLFCSFDDYTVKL